MLDSAQAIWQAWKKRKTAADAAVDLPSYAGLRASLPEATCIHDSTFMQVSMSALLLAMSNQDMNKSLLGSSDAIPVIEVDDSHLSMMEHRSLRPKHKRQLAFKLWD